MPDQECVPKKGKINIICWSLLIGSFSWATFLGATNIKYDRDADKRFVELSKEVILRDEVITKDVANELKEINRVQNEMNYRLIRIETKLSRLVK